MLDQQELLKYPNYLLSNYQLEIYRQLALYMKERNLKKKDMAKELKVSGPYISQILNGEFNFTLKKLIELALAIGKVPYLEFITPTEYWRREKEGTIKYIVQKNTYHVHVSSSVVAIAGDDLHYGNIIDYKGGTLPSSVTKTGVLVK